MTRLAAFIFIGMLAILTIIVLNEHAPQNGGVPVVKSAYHPVAWRLNSVCMIDQHKGGEHIV